jgi:plastocyanin
MMGIEAMISRRRSISVLLLATLIAPAAFVAAQVRGPAAPAPAPAKPAKHAVTIKDMKFNPADLSIKPGDTVVWTNSDDVDHTVVDSGKAFSSENLKPGKSFTFKFDKVGKFSYSCTYHPRMKGTITVAEDKDAKPPAGR